ncbi:MAG: ATP-binding protein [Myxococcales bacterium]
MGGVLLSGTKGTGKSTAVRALRSILPPLEEGRPIPFVELPLNATEDRVAGTLDVETALKLGERRFEPGLLAAADRGFLYVDEVNLLDNHLVDLLLDAAASGVNTVEREGISHSHPARFVLVGTMNPEEGNLRPQFLDRFGLFASVSDIADLALREEIARRRLAFDAAPAAFLEQFEAEQRELAARLERARRSVGQVAVSDEMVSLAVRLASQAETRGHRAEIALLKCARAIAALVDRPAVDREALGDAARFVLPHRMATGTLESPERQDARLRDLVGSVLNDDLGMAPEPAAEELAPDESLEDSLLSMQIPGSTAAGSILFSAQKKTPPRARMRPKS